MLNGCNDGTELTGTALTGTALTGRGGNVLVIGGGIVGVCNALALQRAGFSVTLVDRGQPGRETSYGNAGVLCESAISVVNSPGLLKALPKLLFGRSNGLRFSVSYVVRRIGWMLRFLSYANRRHWRAAARALRDLQLISLDQHKQWIAEAGVGHLLRHGAWMKVFRTDASFEAYEERQLLDEVGSNYTVFEREQIRQIEPALKPIYAKALLLEDTCQVSSPADLTDAYLEMFKAAGGTVVQTKVTGLAQTGNADAGPHDAGPHKAGPDWQVTTSDAGVLTGDQIIIAAGAWSAEIAGWLGYDLPLGWERGYHLHLAPDDGPQLTRAVLDMDGGFAMAPMRQGVRITSGVEITDRDAPPNYQQINASVGQARDALALKDEIEDTPWMGRRPTMIDSLPVIGSAPRHHGLWFNFGHQHVGLSMAPGSALAISAMMQGHNTPIDMHPFRASRFRI